MNELYDYQRAGVQHLLSRPFGKPHALLADSPGTGKTIMAIDAAKQAGCKNGLVICPAIAKEQWARQMVKWQLCAEDEIQILYGENAEVTNRPWVITNYHLIRRPQIRQQLSARKWHCAKLDEAHNFKTHDSQQTLAVFHRTYGIAHSAYWKWALSGSIVMNRPLELYPILKTMAPEVIKPHDTFQAFMTRWCGGGFEQGRGASNIPDLTARIQPFMLRRELRDVWRECPEILENTVWLRVPYEDHPEWSPAMYEATERRVVAEAKAPQVAAYVTDRLESGIDKIAVVSFHRKVIETLEKALSKFHPVKIYGGFSATKRLASIAKFTDDAACRVILLQIASAGEAIDGLQHATSELVEAEPEWSPGREDQAISRVWRLGQTKPVILTKLFAADSYEEAIYYSNLRKREVIDVILQPNGGNFVMSLDSDFKSMAKSLETIAAYFSSQAAGAVAQVANALPQAVGQQAPVAAPQAAPPLQLVPPVQPQIPAQSFAPPALNPTPVMPSAVTLQTPGIPAGIVPAAPVGVVASNGGMSREEFEQKVLAKLQPMGQNGFEVLAQLNARFGVSRLGELPDAHFQNFLNSLG